MASGMGMNRPRAVSNIARLEQTDPRVAMVLEVLGGSTHAEVAARWSADVDLVGRWVRCFVEAGGAAVTNRPLPAAAQERDRFLTAFAHELRTPLTVARMWVELLAADDLSPVMLTRGLVALQDAVARMIDRVTDVELLAAASLGRITVERERISVDDLVSALSPSAELSTGADATHVVVDPEKFRRLLRDFWDAAALAPTPRALRIETLTVGPWVEIRVVRDADPIDATILHALLEPFSAENVNNDGTGITIGLYLARALAVAHGGAIGLEQDDDGLVLWVRVPQNSMQHPNDTPLTAGARTGDRP